MSNPLFDDSDDNSEKAFELKTNKDYAKSYNHLRKKELLQKFNNRRLDASATESSSDSDSSEEDEVLDPTFDQEFLKTLASLKSKDPTIYDKNIKFFQKVNNSTDDEDTDSGGDEDDGKTGKAKKKNKKTKPVTLKDYERKIILEKGGKFEDDSDEEDAPTKNPFRAPSPTLVEEEQRLRDEFKNVINQNDSSDEEFGGIFKKREKTKAEQDKEEEDYLKWLAGKNENINEEAQEKLKPLKTYWNSEKLPSSEKFLRDYILNKGYTDANNYSEIPTYEEIVGDNAPLSEDEEELEKQAEFEQKYNFRFEDPDQEFIKRYPRTVESSVRISDDKRKQKRQEVKERKAREKEEKMQELEMIKGMKRKEIEEKIQKLKMVTGNDELGFKDDDLEEDFDPDAHDRRMQELFNDDYYKYDEGEEKPECPSDIDELKLEDWDNYDPNKEWNAEGSVDYDVHCEDEDFNMDCDYDPAKAKEELQRELIDNTRKRKGRKGRRDRFMEIIKTEKPVFDPEDEKTYGEYIDEYYKLDCEDIIGDTPCRFKYVETTPNDFGLTIMEILLAKNKELNQWASLKKAVQIRPDHVEKKEQRLYKLKAKNEDLKRKIFKSLYEEKGSDNENEDDDAPGQMKPTSETRKDAGEDNANAEQSQSKKPKKGRKRKAANASSQPTEITPTDENKTSETLQSNVVSKNDDVESEAKKQKLTAQAETETAVEQQNTSENSEQKKKKKKNRKKKKSQIAGDATSSERTNKPNEYVKNTSPNKETVHSFGKKKSNNNDNTSLKNTAANKNNPFANSNKSSENIKNKFKTSSEIKLGSLPPLRQNLPKTKNRDNKFKAKLTYNKKPLIGKKSKGGISEDVAVCDERFKAYGINPKKFHKKRKYGSSADKQQKKVA